jgi:4-hydroxyphenylpyruvate dioxygenase
VLGLELQSGHELAALDGLVRSRAARSEDGRVRFALSVPLVGTSGAAELEHVALACDAIFSAARAMRERGVPLLTVSSNYYDDLETRIDLDPALVERLREFCILYDADADGGELLHFFTTVVGPRLFFEVVERRAGYDGYGAANSPVRMAAQRQRSVAPAG